jgi:hypothetical protein
MFILIRRSCKLYSQSIQSDRLSVQSSELGPPLPNSLPCTLCMTVMNITIKKDSRSLSSVHTIQSVHRQILHTKKDSSNSPTSLQTTAVRSTFLSIDLKQVQYFLYEAV